MQNKIFKISKKKKNRIRFCKFVKIYIENSKYFLFEY